MRVFGIDPGSISGAWACIDTLRKTAFVGDIPVLDSNVNSAELARLLDLYDPDKVVVERVGAMPHQGVSSVFSFGRGVGRIEGVVGCSSYSLEYLTPQVWKKHYKLPGGPKNKELSRARAIELYPAVAGLSLKRHSGRAEALLIAHYYVEKRA